MRCFKYYCGVDLACAGLAIVLVVGGEDVAWAQLTLSLGNPTSYADPHDFSDPKGTVLVTGEFIKLANGYVEVKTQDGETKKVPFNELSDEDKAFVKDSIEVGKRKEKASDVLREQQGLLQSTRPSDVIKGCKKIRTLGKYGEPAADSMLGLINGATDERVRYELFLTYVEVRSPSDRNFESLFRTLTAQDNHDIEERIVSNPRAFLESYATMGEPGLEYLKFVAFTGTVIPDRFPPISPVAPTEFAVVDREQWANRAMACEAIGLIESPISLSAIMDLLGVVEKPVLGEVDTKSIEACLMALGNIGLTDDDVEAALKRHASAFPEVVSRSQKQLQAKQTETSDK